MGPGAIHFAGSRLRLVGLDVVQQDAHRQPPVVRAHAARGLPRSGDTVEINSRNVAREMRLASHANADLSPYAAARTESRQPFIKPAITPQDKARYERLVAAKVEERREASSPARPASPDRAHTPAHTPRVHSHQSLPELDLLAADARFRFASEVARHLEGGKAAILRPERRDVLIVSAVRDGILAFDANLVIALVQDATRRGDLVTPETIQTPIQDNPAVSYNEGIRDYLIAVVSSMRVATLLPLIRIAGHDAPVRRTRESTAFAQAAVAVALAALLLIGMIATLGA